MTLSTRYPLGAPQQALFATMVFLPQPTLTERSSAADEPGPPDEAAELVPDFEDHTNHFIGE
jgi:hypothetical protein